MRIRKNGRTILDVNDKAWTELYGRALAVNGAHVKVGVLSAKGGAAAHQGDPITMVELAAIHEFGSPSANIPERSFIRRTFSFQRIGLDEIVAKLAKAILSGRMDALTALNLLGAWGVAQVRKTITADQHIPPPLKPATIAAKGSDRPLVDTGRLAASISYLVSLGAAPDAPETQATEA